MTSYAAPVAGRTGDGCPLRQISLAVQAVDVIGLERSVGGKVERVLGRNGRHGTGLLLALQDDFDVCEVVRRPEDAAFIAVVAGENPETVGPWIVNDVMDVTGDALGECVGHVPSLAGVRRRIDVNGIAERVVEILSPIDRASGDGGDVERARTANDGMSYPEFRFVKVARDDSARNSGDESAARENR